MLPYYPLGVVRDVTADGFANAAEAASARTPPAPSPILRLCQKEATTGKDSPVSSPASAAKGRVFAGKVIATAGLIDNREVSWMPSYGPSKCGGTANCSVTLSG